MRVLILFLLASIAYAEDARDLVDQAYRTDEVREHCLKEPDGTITVEIEGQKVPVECVYWTRWYQAEQAKEK